MKKCVVAATLLLLGCVLNLHAQNTIYIYQTNYSIYSETISTIYDIEFNSMQDSIVFYHYDNAPSAYAIQDIDSISVVEPAEPTADACVEIYYNGSDDVTIVNPYAVKGVTLTAENGNVVVNSTIDEEIEYILSGTGTGSLKVYSDKKLKLTLNGVSLTSTDGPAINIQSGKKTTVTLSEGTVNNLSDCSTYTTNGDEDMKGCLFSEGQLVFEGTGTLKVVGLYNHAIASDDYIEITSGVITVSSAVNDGIHSNDYFSMEGGTLTISGFAGDGIDGDTGYILINGGTLNVTAATADTKAIKCDSLLAINGGDLTIRLTGDQTKGLKSEQAIEINDGTLTFTATGKAVVTNYEPSYCTAIKSDNTVTINGGTITLTHSGIGGKGISADGVLTINGGTLNLTTTGDGATYTASSGTDAYSACCIKGDAAIAIYGGNLTLKSTGTGGKCISGDNAMTFGKLNDETAYPIVSATTTGASLGTSNDQPGGGGFGGGGRPGGGGGTTTTTAHKSSKAIKADGAIIINNGVITTSTATDGAEGIESKTSYTQNGGDVICNNYDDCINSSGKIIFNGGRTYCYATKNDAIDSNNSSSGAVTIAGGIVLALSAAGSPEEGIDSDNASLVVSGGYLFTMGAAQSSAPSVPTTSTATQPTCLLTSMSLTKGQYFTVADNSGNNIFTLLIPFTLSGNYSVVTAPDFVKGSTYTFKTGTTAPTDATSVFQGFYLGSSCKGTTSKKTITFSANYVKG